MKVVINACFGGFSISKKAAVFMAENGCKQAEVELTESKGDNFYGYGYGKEYNDGCDRTDPLLVLAVETLGQEASGMCAKLKVVEIPDGIEFEISEYDGYESVEEKHRSWS